MEPFQLIDLVERREANPQVELDNDNIRIQRKDIDRVGVEAPSLNSEEEIDLVGVDDSDHEDLDDYSDSATDEETTKHDEVKDDDWM
ncbi:hypothetical protein P3S68_028183 [Capsicum galapagoense]